MEKEAKTLVTPAVGNSPAFGRKIRRLREERGISMVELSRATGVHYASVSAFELGKRKAISVEKAKILYEYLNSIPVARTPLVTTPGNYSKKRKHRKASVAKQTAATPVTPSAPAKEQIKPDAPAEKPEPVPAQIYCLHDLLREVSIRALRGCRQLVEEIDNPQTPDVVRVVDTQELITLTNFLKENWGYLK